MEEYSIHLPEDCGINISTVDSYYENDLWGSQRYGP